MKQRHALARLVEVTRKACGSAQQRPRMKAQIGTLLAAGACLSAPAFSAVYCDETDSSFCMYFGSAYSTSCPSGTTTVSACPTANLLGTCTDTYTSGSYSSTTVTYWYARNGITADSASYFAQSCTSSGDVWSGSGTGPTANTALPSPPASQSAYTASNGQLPEAATQVQASGTYGSAKLSVILNVAAALRANGTRNNRAAGTYNVYVVAMLPGALAGSASPVLYVKPPAPASWRPLQWPMAAFMSNVAQSAVNDEVTVEILDNTNLLGLIGAEIYIGYGTSDQEMLAANRFRGVYKVQ